MLGLGWVIGIRSDSGKTFGGVRPASLGLTQDSSVFLIKRMLSSLKFFRLPRLVMCGIFLFLGNSMIGKLIFLVISFKVLKMYSFLFCF